jgi:hypothetical protein
MHHLGHQGRRFDKSSLTRTTYEQARSGAPSSRRLSAAGRQPSVYVGSKGMVNWAKAAKCGLTGSIWTRLIEMVDLNNGGAHAEDEVQPRTEGR